MTEKKKSIIVTILVVLCITGLEIVALMNGINGWIFTTVVALLAGIGGWHLPQLQIREKFK